jgi:hypothetical protein
LLDSVVGFDFHVRGIARQPGGRRMPITNLAMAYLGPSASFLWREDSSHKRVYAIDGNRRPKSSVEVQVGRLCRRNQLAARLIDHVEPPPA